MATATLHTPFLEFNDQLLCALFYQLLSVVSFSLDHLQLAVLLAVQPFQLLALLRRAAGRGLPIYCLATFQCHVRGFRVHKVSRYRVTDRGGARYGGYTWGAHMGGTMGYMWTAVLWCPTLQWRGGKHYQSQDSIAANCSLCSIKSELCCKAWDPYNELDTMHRAVI